LEILPVREEEIRPPRPDFGWILLLGNRSFSAGIIIRQCDM
jgi:hypothetical protein